MFEKLSDKLDAAFKKLKGRGKLTEKNIEEGLNAASSLSLNFSNIIIPA